MRRSARGDSRRQRPYLFDICLAARRAASEHFRLCSGFIGLGRMISAWVVVATAKKIGLGP
jgi:hypothetical protein